MMLQSAFRGLLAALLLAFPAIEIGAAEAARLFSADDGAVPPRQASKRLLRADSFPEGGELGTAAGGAGELELRGGGLALGGAASSAALRSRVAEVDLGLLESARLGVAGRRQVRLGLNLFADAAFDAAFERSAPTASGYTLAGRLEDDPLSAVVLAVNGEWVAGQVWGRRGRYFILPLGGGVSAVQQMDPSVSVRCGVEEDLAEGARGAFPPVADQLAAGRPLGAAVSGTAPASQAYPEDDGDLIDLLVVYRWFESRLAGGRQAMRALIDSDVAMTNELYRASGAVQRINLVAAVELERRPEDRDLKFSYVEELRHGWSERWREAHVLRDAYAADIVLGHWGHRLGGDLLGRPLVGGRAYTTEEHDPRYESSAFSAAASISFAHVLGHNMGLRHERAIDRGNTPFPYSHGYVVPDNSPELPPERGRLGMQTIMAAFVDPLRNIPRFSNPSLRYPDESGPVIGVPGDAPSDSADGPADAVRGLNQMRRLVANFRRSASRCRYELSPPPSPLPASGGIFLIRVKAGADCAWRARSNDEFVSFADEAAGVGDGEIAFRVSANPGWERDLAVFVAGEAYLAEQATAKTRRETPACDRAPPIRAALVEAAGKPCEEIGAEDLAAVRTLNPLSFPPGAKPDERRLAPGDFDGLTGLVSLDLGSMNLTGLAPGTFGGLLRLFSLDLRENELAELAAGAFDGLRNLAELNFAFNWDLKTLEPGAFRGLYGLHELLLKGTALTALEPGTFRGLSELQVLDLEANRNLTVLEPGVFRGLSELRTLHIDNHSSLIALRAGLFEDLSKLEILHIFGNSRLTTLEAGLFDGLVELDNLIIIHNRLKTLAPGLFDGLVELDHLTLSDNQLKTLAPGLLRGPEKLAMLFLNGNQLRSLAPGLFEGAGVWYLRVDLRDNPGAPFVLIPELIRRPGAGSAPNGTAQITAEVVQGAPSPMRIPLSAIGGALSAEEVLIPLGAVRGTAVSVVPQGNGPVIVQASAPSLPTPCSDQQLWWTASPYSGPCQRGLKTASGAPLILYGLPDRTLALGGAVRFDLPTAFPNFGAGASYAVESSHPAAFEVLIREGLLIVSAAAGGETILTVTATGSDGRRETRRFAVKAPVVPLVRSRWGGWRSVLLKPPSSEDGDES